MEDKQNEDYVAWLDQLWAQRLSPARETRPELSIGILLWPDFPLLSLTGIVEPLRHAGDFADHSRPLYCRWHVLGEGATASCGIPVAATAPYANPEEFDYIAVIGGLLPNLRRAPRRHRDYLRAAAASGVPIIGICTGVFVLAEEGLLADAKASVHPFHAQDYRLAFPRGAISTRHDFLHDKGRLTVPGGVSILSLMTELIHRHCGPDRAAKAVHQLSLTERKEVGAFERMRAGEYHQAADARIQRALVLIEMRKGNGVTAKQAADAAGLSGRQFTRLFRDSLGVTPKRFILDTRLRYARFLVENSSMPMTAIAFETGFADCAHLTTSFRVRYGAPPRQLRTKRAAG
jgi:transcriptional regulator GlxA family with amidase domain